jgi:hypothetical protein
LLLKAAHCGEDEEMIAFDEVVDFICWHLLKEKFLVDDAQSFLFIEIREGM